MDENKNDISDLKNKIIPNDEENSEKSTIRQFESSIQTLMMSSGPSSIFADKVDASHITQFLDNEEKQAERNLKISRDNKIFTIIIIIFILAFVVGFCIYFKNDKDMIDAIVIPLITLVVGGFGGYGLGCKKRDSAND